MVAAEFPNRAKRCATLGRRRGKVLGGEAVPCPSIRMWGYLTKCLMKLYVSIAFLHAFGLQIHTRRNIMATLFPVKKVGCWPLSSRFWQLCHLHVLMIFTRTWLRYVRIFAIANPFVVCNVHAPYSRSWNFRQYFFAILYLSYPFRFRLRFINIVARRLKSQTMKYNLQQAKQKAIK